MERELSLYVPAPARAGIATAMHAQNAQRIALHALYFDTPSRALAKAGIALRIRREGEQWVQTVKAPGQDPLSRIEINHPREQAELDLTLYNNSPLASFFTELEEPLALRYETDVQRLVLQVEQAGSVIEIAYDDGAILAQGWKLPISEVEFELISGGMGGLFDLAQEWLADHRLILEIRSKAQRGDRLADLDSAPAQPGDASPPTLFEARRAKRLNLSPQLPVAERYVACVGECLLQIMANAALLAGVDVRDATDDDRALQLQQLRLGVRRLRACWKQLPSLAPATQPDITRAFSRKRPEALSAIAGGPEFQALLLSLLRHLIHVGDVGELENTRA